MSPSASYQRGERVRVGEHLTGVVADPKPFYDPGDREARILVDIDGHDWQARPVLSVVSRISEDDG